MKFPAHLAKLIATHGGTVKSARRRKPPSALADPKLYERRVAALRSRSSVAFFVPVKTVNESNARGHHMGKASRTKKQRETVKMFAECAAAPRSTPLPATVFLTRISRGTVDDDGLRSCLKPARDAIAAWLGVDDGDTERVRFEYDQERGVGFGLLVEVRARSRA